MRDGRRRKAEREHAVEGQYIWRKGYTPGKKFPDHFLGFRALRLRHSIPYTPHSSLGWRTEDGLYQRPVVLKQLDLASAVDLACAVELALDLGIITVGNGAVDGTRSR